MIIVLWCSLFMGVLACSPGKTEDEDTKDKELTEHKQAGGRNAQNGGNKYSFPEVVDEPTKPGKDTPAAPSEHAQILIVAGEDKNNPLQQLENGKSYWAWSDVEILKGPSAKDHNCNKPPDYPIKVMAMAFGAYQKKAIICGGAPHNKELINVKLPDGRIFEAPYYGKATAKCYEYHDNRWNKIPSMSTPRSWFAGVWTPDWKWWVIGGLNPRPKADMDNAWLDFLDTTELYDPKTKTWSSGPTAKKPYWSHCAVALDQHRERVLITTGNGGIWEGDEVPMNRTLLQYPSYVFVWSSKSWDPAPQVPITQFENGCTVCGKIKGTKGYVILMTAQGKWMLSNTDEGQIGSTWESLGKGIHGGSIFYDQEKDMTYLVGSDDDTGNIVYKFEDDHWVATDMKTKGQRYHSAAVMLSDEALEC